MIKAIETVYRGYRFRSRLEARWAVFFDTLGVQYQYEPEGFELEEFGRYLPDFFIPTIGWLEIKPHGYEPYQQAKDDPIAALLNCYETGLALPGGQFYLIVGEPGPSCHYHNTYEGWSMNDNPFLFCECPDCGRIGLQFDGRADRMPCKECYYCAVIREGQTRRAFVDDPSALAQGICPIHGTTYETGRCRRRGCNCDRGHNSDSPRIIDALLAGKQARFEYGEGGR